MAQADIETLTLAYKGLSRGDWDAFFRPARPDFEYILPDGVLVAGTFHGVEEARRVLEDQLEPFEDVVAEPEEFFEHGDRIVVFLRVRSRPRDSRVVMEVRVAHVWTMRDGKAARCELFPVREQALEAVGLSQ